MAKLLFGSAALVMFAAAMTANTQANGSAEPAEDQATAYTRPIVKEFAARRQAEMRFAKVVRTADAAPVVSTTVCGPGDREKCGLEPDTIVAATGPAMRPHVVIEGGLKGSSFHKHHHLQHFHVKYRDDNAVYDAHHLHHDYHTHHRYDHHHHRHYHHKHRKDGHHDHIE